MPPFGKATRNEDNPVLTALEKDAQARIARALDELRKDIFRGVTESNAHIMARRLDDPAVIRPFEDAISELVEEWVMSGVDGGRTELDRAVANA
jgi:hypothetical protein